MNNSEHLAAIDQFEKAARKLCDDLHLIEHRLQIVEHPYGNLGLSSERHDIETIWRLIENSATDAHSCLQKLPRKIVRDDPVVFNHHVAVSYAECLVETGMEVFLTVASAAQVDYGDSDIDTTDTGLPHPGTVLPLTETESVELASMLKSAISEWQGIEHLSVDTTRPVHALFAAVATELQRERSRIENLPPISAKSIDDRPSVSMEAKKDVRAVPTSFTAKLKATIHSDRRQISRGGFPIAAGPFPEKQSWPLMLRLLAAGEEGCTCMSLTAWLETDPGAVHTAIGELRRLLMPIGLTVSQARSGKPYLIMTNDISGDF